MSTMATKLGMFVCLFVCQRDPPPRPQQRSLTLPRFGILRAYATYWNLRSLWTGSLAVCPSMTRQRLPQAAKTREEYVNVIACHSTTP